MTTRPDPIPRPPSDAVSAGTAADAGRRPGHARSAGPGPGRPRRPAADAARSGAARRRPAPYGVTRAQRRRRPVRRASAGVGRGSTSSSAWPLAVAVGGVAFAVGRTTAPASAATGQTAAAGTAASSPNGSGDPRGSGAPGAAAVRRLRWRRGAGRPDDQRHGRRPSTATRLTIKTATGQTVEVATDASTTYHAGSRRRAT